MRDLERPGRSIVHALHGAAATSQPQSTLTAIEVLRNGGNALDAAIAACAVQCVVEPGSTGVGGDCFALWSPRGTTPPIAYNGSGRAPANVDADALAARHGARIPRQSADAVTVPGSVEAWERLNRDHGVLPLHELLQPAIRLAREGYVVHERVAFDWRANEATLARDAPSAALFLPGGRAPAAGQVHTQPRLAATLARVAEHGAAGFYHGPVAEDIVARLAELGGAHTLADFAEARGDYVTPIAGDYRGMRIYECPPSTQGVTALELLNVLSHLPVADGPLSPERLHCFVEASRLAYVDRDTAVADPEAAHVPVEALLSDGHARELAGRIAPDRTVAGATDIPAPTAQSTVYICVVDAERNVASFINSLFTPFGNALSAPASGVLLNCRATGFSLEPGHPNRIAPSKRPLHTLIPGLAARAERAVMPFGVMGAQYQAAGHAYFLQNLLEQGLDLQEAIDLPRLFAADGVHVDIEGGIPPAAVAGLHEKGHVTRRSEKPLGGAQAIWIDWENGVLSAASDPRKDGCALGY